MTRILHKPARQACAFLAVVGAAATLAACGGSDNTFVAPPTAVVTVTDPPPPPPPPPTPEPEPEGTAAEQAGAGFAFAFNQSPFDEPVEPVEGDIIPLDLTAEPIPVPDP